MDALYEKQIIGAIISGLVRPKDLDIDPSDFSETDLGTTYAQLREMNDNEISPEAVLDQLVSDSYGFYSKSDLLEWSKMVTTANGAYYAAQKVRQESCRTYLLSRASIIANSEVGSQDLLTKYRETIQEAERRWGSQKESFVLLSDAAPKVEARIQDAVEGRVDAISTGFPMWDSLMLDGFAKKDLHIVAGFTGSGKTALILNCMRNQALQGIGVADVSREMARTENIIRLISSHGEVPRWYLRRHMKEEDAEKFRTALDEIRHLPIYIDVDTKTVQSIRANVKPFVEDGKIQILYVDYLQLVNSNDKGDKRADEISQVSRGLKEIAMEFNIPVVAACQFNRSGVHADIFDLLYFLKESSSIEQDASTITYIQTEKTDEHKRVKEAKLTILKNRNGACFNPVDMEFIGESFLFREKRSAAGEYWYND